VIALTAAFLTTVARSPIRTVTAKDGKNEPKIIYPESKKVDQVDDYFGTKVADPYRWLEDENSAETKAWVQAQNAVTFAYLDKIPYREKL
jgi:prolyl oligopeptidase